MLSIHSLAGVKCHGHLTSHNVFVDLKKTNSNVFDLKVRISDLECLDLIMYANMFFDYRVASVWSSPEVLRHAKKVNNPSVAMDTYSFGLVLWELWHQSIPFDNHVPTAVKYILNEESRPKLI